MTQTQTLRARQKLLDRLPLTGEVLRGPLLEQGVPPQSGAARTSSGMPSSAGSRRIIRGPSLVRSEPALDL
jgi:hypothetical protein